LKKNFYNIFAFLFLEDSLKKRVCESFCFSFSIWFGTL